MFFLTKRTFQLGIVSFNFCSPVNWYFVVVCLLFCCLFFVGVFVLNFQ